MLEKKKANKPMKGVKKVISILVRIISIVECFQRQRNLMILQAKWVYRLG
jgi:hypothetical protein